MPHFLLGGISFYQRTLIFVQLLIFLVMISQFSQNQNFNFTIFACLTLPRSSAKAIHRNAWWYCPIAIKTIKILCMNFLLCMHKAPRLNHAKFGLYQVCAQRENCPYSEFFWSRFFWSFSRIWTEYRDLLCKSPYSVQMRKLRTIKTQNTDNFYTAMVFILQLINLKSVSFCSKLPYLNSHVIFL